ncbi:hypothetical protein GOV12_01340 [Candidatus Pacearchaeota archaeon]|nr:hypothetical protein [Candidatus Pacearchaeota archaeon]
MLEKTVYLTGPSGTGKSAIINILIEKYRGYVGGCSMDGRRNDGENFLSYESAKEEIDRRIAESENHMMIQERNFGKVILCESCMYDTRSYISAALKSDDLTEEEALKLFEYQDKEHLVDLRPKNMIFINYPVRYIQRFLQRRQYSGSFGFREDDIEYLNRVSESFEESIKDVGGVSVHFLRDPHGFYISDVDTVIRKMIGIS